jgi:hypothetical protein
MGAISFAALGDHLRSLTIENTLKQIVSVTVIERWRRQSMKRFSRSWWRR